MPVSRGASSRFSALVVWSIVASVASFASACSGTNAADTGSNPGPDAGGMDARATDTGSGNDTGTGGDASGQDVPPGVDTGSHGDGGPGQDVGPSPDSGGLASLSDEFNGSSLDPSWNVFNGSGVTISVHDGALYLQPTRALLWYNASEGMQISKMVTGDFKATAVVHARKASDPTMPPDFGEQLGGVMARDPTAPPENYVFVVVGRNPTQVIVETKSTVNSNSMYQGPAWPNGDAELRLCRVGSTFMLYMRAIGDTTWQSAMTFTRPDLPGTLAVGPNAFAYNLNVSGGGTPDLIVSFDRFAFASVSGMADCTVD
jgi:hypothetical protein